MRARARGGGRGDPVWALFPGQRGNVWRAKMFLLSDVRNLGPGLGKVRLGPPPGAVLIPSMRSF